MWMNQLNQNKMNNEDRNLIAKQHCNKLIAEFMCDSTRLHGLQLQYHTSWDWLMPVVQKCFDAQEPTEGQHYFINESLLTMDIEVVYDRVVEFIKEYDDEKRS